MSITIIDDNSLQGPVFHLGTTLVPHGELAIIQPPNQGIQSVWENMVGYFNKSQNEHGYDKKITDKIRRL